MKVSILYAPRAKRLYLYRSKLDPHRNDRDIETVTIRAGSCSATIHLPKEKHERRPKKKAVVSRPRSRN